MIPSPSIPDALNYFTTSKKMINRSVTIIFTVDYMKLVSIIGVASGIAPKVWYEFPTISISEVCSIC